MKCKSNKTLDEYLYICPNCFNKLVDCKCVCYPETLIQIDRKIYPIIKILNQKWYFTTSCCEGHINMGDKIFIIFKKTYKFNQALPQGFDNSQDCIIAKIDGKTTLSKTRRKNKLLRALLEWADTLEPRCSLPLPGVDFKKISSGDYHV